MIRFPRRRLLQLGAGAAAFFAVTRWAWAQAYPSRPVRIIVGFSAGGPTDTLARLMGQWLTERLRQILPRRESTGCGQQSCNGGGREGRTGWSNLAPHHGSECGQRNAV